MRHPSHSKFCTRATHSLTHLPAPAPTAHTSLPTPARPLVRPTRYCAWWTRATASPGRAGLHARAGAALGTFDVARLSERTDEQELRMHGDGTEGGSQGSWAVAGW